MGNFESESALKQEDTFYKHVLELNFGTIKGLSYEALKITALCAYNIVHDHASFKNKCTNCNSIMYCSLFLTCRRKIKSQKLHEICTKVHTKTMYNGWRFLILVTQEPNACRSIHRRCRHENPSCLVPCL